MGRFLRVVVVLFILTGPVFWYFFLRASKHHYTLPYLGERYAETVTGADGKPKTDTIYQTVPDFSFIDQYGKAFTQDRVKGKIYVVNFFFSTCQDVCPEINSNIDSVVALYKKDNDVIFVSHTVDPELDTPQVLKEYAKRFKSLSPNWYFVTGNKDSLYKQAMQGYLLSAGEDPTVLPRFFHSEKVVLIDKSRHIRGMYEGRDRNDIKRLAEEIKVLKVIEGDK